jgi:hypothetical protein
MIRDTVSPGFVTSFFWEMRQAERLCPMSVMAFSEKL